MKNLVRGLFLILLFLRIGFADEYGKVTQTRVADGVYLFSVSRYGDVGMSGNVVLIMNENGGLVFDSSGTPETAKTILREIQSISNRPLQYLVNSHWHWDHWGGNQVFLAAFPGLQIITHEKTLDAMLHIEPQWNDEGLKVQLPAYLKDLEKHVQEARSKNTSSEDAAQMDALLQADRKFLAEKTSLQKTYPNLTFSDSITLHPAGREIQILHARAITPGDTFLFLSKEKILVTGDILLDPYPFAIGGTYPSEWLQALKRFDSMAPEIIIPGHGNPVKEDFLRKQIQLFEQVVNLTKDCHSKGMTIDQTVDFVGKQSAKLAAIIGINEGKDFQQFRSYFLDVFVSRTFKELNHPLGDSPRE